MILISQLSKLTNFDEDIIICILISSFFGLMGWINKYVPINFGRHLNSVSKIQVPNTIAWMIFEGPNLLVSIYFIFFGKIKDLNNYVMIAPFFLHYIHRVLIYPIRNPS
jgi:hypothetical protein